MFSPSSPWNRPKEPPSSSPEGGLLGVNDGAWLAVNGQPVAYYHTATVDDGESYAITGLRAPPPSSNAVRTNP